MTSCRAAGDRKGPVTTPPPERGRGDFMKYRTINIVPSVPPELQPLKELAFNLFWSWNDEVIGLFRRLDPELWESSGHNPVAMLGSIKQERLTRAARDKAFLVHMDRARRSLEACVKESEWFRATHPDEKDLLIAYFSMEFGLTDCLHIYSGGLGILAGDHLKSACELGLPLVGVGLLYQEGYFRQYLNPDGWQQESYPRNDFYNLPIVPVLKGDGSALTVEVEFPEGPCQVKVWRAQLGHIRLFLLDTNVQANTRHLQDITDRLYGGDQEMRIRQEIVLGIGGYRALLAMGLEPTICHMNEGHSAFMSVERSRTFMDTSHCTYEEARQISRTANVFTTHTAVPAGFDVFHPDLIRRYFGGYVARIGLTLDEFLSLGRDAGNSREQGFSMATCAIRHSSTRNAVSKIHGKVTQRMLGHLWPGLPEQEVPIDSITNGIHIRSWISKDMGELFDRYLGPPWREDPVDKKVWDLVDQIPDEELWRTHERRRERLVAFVRQALTNQLASRGKSEREVNDARGILDSKALTIGFARRFADYKRAALILSDPDRLKRLITDKERPVQILFAGEAHPRDDRGKQIIQQIVRFASDPELRRHVTFIEGYDINVARYLVQGVDVWLNNPRMLHEASGTSGMKVVPNGGINLSVPDGWWHEAYEKGVGWSIGKGEVYGDLAYQDRVESSELYTILEQDVIPLFYAREENGLPRGWLKLMKTSMRTLCPWFNTNRMVHEYTERFYVPSARRYRELVASNLARGLAAVHWKEHIRRNWGDVKVLHVDGGVIDHVEVGMHLTVTCSAALGALSPEDVEIQLYFGALNSNREIVSGRVAPMRCVGRNNGYHVFEGEIPCDASGLTGYAVRVMPRHPDVKAPGEFLFMSPGAEAA
jgi:glycogen phosphorylase